MDMFANILNFNIPSLKKKSFQKCKNVVVINENKTRYMVEKCRYTRSINIIRQSLLAGVKFAFFTLRKKN